MSRQPERGTARNFWLPGLLSSVVLGLIPASASAWQYPVYDGTPASVRNAYNASAPTYGQAQAIQDHYQRQASIRRVAEQAAASEATRDPFGTPSPGRGEERAVAVPSGPSPGGTNSGPPPASAAPAAAPEPSLQEKAGRASMIAAKSAEQVQEQLTRLRQVIEQAIAAHERAPAFDPARESQRIGAFERLLAEAVRLGERATADEVALRQRFEIWQKASGAAAGFFREAENHFRDRADRESFPRAREMYAKSADWYAARAARHELRSKFVIPSEFGEQMQELRAMTAACRELLTWVHNDAYYLEDGAGIGSDLAAFLSAFSAVNDVLDTWTEKLLEDMEEPEEPEPPAEPASAPQAGRSMTGGPPRTAVRLASQSAPAVRPSVPTGTGVEGDFLSHVAAD